MIVGSAITGSLPGVLDRMLDGGFVVVLALICLIQYILHLHYVAQASREYRTSTTELNNLRSEQSHIQIEHELTRMENRLLCDFVSQTNFRNALDLILQSFASDTVRDFAVLLRIDEHSIHVCRGYHLSHESVERITVDETLVERLYPGRVIELTGEDYQSTQLFESLAMRDRSKRDRVFLLGLGQHAELTGILLSTNLYPANADKEQQIELASRLASKIAGNVERFYCFEQKEEQLRLTREMLELRNVTDRQYDSPLEMVEEYLFELRQMVDADAGTVFVGPYDHSLETATEQKPMVRVWGDVPLELRSRHQQAESDLITLHKGHRDVVVIDNNTSADDPRVIEHAVLAPLIQKNRWVGAFCLSNCKKHSKVFTQHERDLISWAANHLSETLVRIQVVADMARQANRDSLTDLANRRFFDQALFEQVTTARTDGSEFSLLLCDLDHFKTINDTWGHQAGDEVLRVVARILSEQTSKMRSGESALTARYGGEELAILLYGVGSMGANRIAEQIRESLSLETVWYRRIPIRVTMSIGFATFPVHATSEENLVAAADAGLYRAKNSGRNLVCGPPENWRESSRIESGQPAFRKMPALDSSNQ